MNRRATNCHWWMSRHSADFRRRCRRILLSALLALFTVPALSEPPVILLLESGNAAVYRKVSSSILAGLDSICTECKRYQIKQLNLDDTPADGFFISEDSGIALIVSIGVRAARLISTSKNSIPRLYTLIPNSTAAALRIDQTSDKISTIYLDQPIRRQLHLVKLITTKNQVLGVLLGPETSALRTTLALTAEKLGIPIQLETATADDQIGPALKRLLDSSDIILALPDPLVYNRNTIFNILLSSYHSRIPVIGFSASYVKAGAMLAIHSTPRDIGMHIAETIRRFVIAGGDHLFDSESPKYFSIEINASVARSLDRNLLDSTELQQQLEQQEAQ